LVLRKRLVQSFGDNLFDLGPSVAICGVSKSFGVEAAGIAAVALELDLPDDSTFGRGG